MTVEAFEILAVNGLKLLFLLKPVPMVKPLAFDPTDRSVCGDDLFAAVLPMNVLKAVSVYAEEKAKFRRSILEKVAIKDQDLEYVGFEFFLYVDFITIS